MAFSISVKSHKKIIVVSLSLQIIASIGAKYNLTMQETAEKLASFCHQIGIDYIYDITIARHIALVETEKKFSEKFETHNSQCCVPFVLVGFVTLKKLMGNYWFHF